jgi:hypothetical protein
VVEYLALVDRRYEAPTLPNLAELLESRRRRVAPPLRPYGIRPKDVKLAGQVLKGYRAEDFADAWSRYCGVSATSATLPMQQGFEGSGYETASATSATPTATPTVPKVAEVADTENQALPANAYGIRKVAEVAEVADNPPYADLKPEDALRLCELCCGDGCQFERGNWRDCPKPKPGQ